MQSSSVACFSSLRFGFLNVNCLLNKLSYITTLLTDFDLDVFGVLETWLLPSTPDSFVSIRGYGVVRTDTTGNFAKHGVCIFIRNSITFVRVACLCPNMCVIFLPKFQLHIVLVYRPPSNGCAEDGLLLDFLLEFCVDKETVIFGDFNLPELDWSQQDCLFADYPPRVQSFVDVFISLGLTQWVTEATFWRSGNILDLILTSEEDRVGSVDVLPPYPSCGHLAIVFTYVFQFGVNCVGGGLARRDWFRGRYGMINNHLSAFDWQLEFHDLTVSAMYNRLKEILEPLIDRYVPLARAASHIKIRHPPPSLKRERSRAWRSYKNLRRLYGRSSVHASQALTVYNDLNDRYRRFFTHSQITFEHSLVSNFTEFPKRFHAYVRSKKIGNPSVGPLRKSDGTLIVKCDEMAEVFADEFSSVYVLDELEHPAPHQICDGTFDRVLFSAEDVSRRLCALDGGSSMGPDGLHPMLLKSCPSLSAPVYLIFQRSLSDGVVPMDWKHSQIVPIFKKGSRHVALNYRPISLTSVCGKTLERIVSDCLYEYLDTHELLSTKQFGFRHGRTVDDQLLLVYNDVSCWLDSGKAVDIVFFDFAKAFDTVSHGLLLAKLRHLGVSGSVFNWLSDFLVDRTMQVSVSGLHSTRKRVDSGVPQGSVLGPLLFLIYVNYLPASVSNNCVFFADDLKIYLKLHHHSSLDLALDLSGCQSDIDAIAATAESWGLKLNPEKCAVLRLSRGSSEWSNTVPPYTLNGSILNVVSSQKDLGVLIDNKLLFHSHIASIVSKASGLSVNLLRSTLCRSADFMVPLFISHIRPLLDFASTIWNTGYLGDLRLLESVQRRWTKKIAGMEELSYAERLTMLNLYSIRGRLLRADLLKCWKVFHGKCGVQPADLFVMAPDVGTRGHRFKLAHTHSSLECRRRFFSLRCVASWNALPDGLVSLDSVEAFKRGLHDVLGPRLFEFVD